MWHPNVGRRLLQRGEDDQLPARLGAGAADRPTVGEEEFESV